MDALNVPPRFLEHFAAIRRLGSNGLADLVSHLRGIQQVPLDAGQLASAISQFFPEGANSVAEQLIALNQLKLEPGMTAPLLVERLTKGIENITPKPRRWSEEELVQWRSLEQQLINLFSTESLDIVSKASELVFEYANLLTSAIVVTDIRPVYDELGETIRAAVISQTLRIYFKGEDGEHSLSIAMDMNDLERLRDHCVKAIKKAEAARQLMSGANVPTLISGDTHAD